MSSQMGPQVATLREELITLIERALECALAAFLPLEFDNLDKRILAIMWLYLQMDQRLIGASLEGVVHHLVLPSVECGLELLVISTTRLSD